MTFRLLAIATIGLIAPAFAQTTFEVASIKPSEPGGRGSRIQILPGGRFQTSNVTVKFLIAQGYGVREFQILGGPAWIGSERYDIVAKPESGSANGADLRSESLKQMIQALLAERFKLEVHRETKELPVYYLTVGKNGLKAGESKEGNGPMMRMGRGQISVQHAPMSMLAMQLSNMLGRQVIDKTGLTGNYDFKLEFTPDDSQTLGPKDVGGETAPPVDSTGPSLYTAVQEQLGLKLESAKGPVEIIVIDHVEKATEN